MKATQKLHDMGQSLWLDNITRGLLTSGGQLQIWYTLVLCWIAL